MRLSAATLLDAVVDLISRTEAISSILDLFRSESGAINMCDIPPIGSITKAAKIFASTSTKFCTLSYDIDIVSSIKCDMVIFMG
jgi:hypothetical protein